MAITASLPAAKSRFGISLPLLVALAAFVAVLAAGIGLMNDPDIYWHIVVGRWILAHHAVPHADIFFLFQGRRAMGSTRMAGRNNLRAAL